MRNRRALLIALGATALAPRAAFAQSKPPILIGWFHADSHEAGSHLLGAFKEGLAGLGWKEGLQIAVAEGWADGRHARLQSLAEELAGKKPAIIVAGPLQAVAAAARAAPTTPIVMANGADPVAAGLVKSHARPGGMITGLTNFSIDVAEKYIELLLAAAPKVKRVGVLGGASPFGGLQWEAVRRSAAQSKVEARLAEVASPEEVEPAVSRLAKEGVQALVVLQAPVLRVERRRILRLALAQRWPVVAGTVGFAEAGALLSYNADALANYRRAAYFVDRILKGTKPGDLPLEQSTKFELVINMKTARMLKLEIPRELAVRADRVIE